MHASPSEGWILAGTLDGNVAFPDLDADVAGMPHVLRLACDLAHAGCRTIHVVWSSELPVPALGSLPDDPRLAGATLDIVTSPPPGDGDDAIATVRGDRICHRDMAKQAIAAWCTSGGAATAVVDSDAVVVTDRNRARRLASALARGAMEPALRELDVTEAAAPYLAFTLAPRNERELRRAQRTMVWSLRKAADGIASAWINRRLSLPITWLLMRSRVHPNHVTVFCMCLALAGAIVMGHGGYAAGAIGMLLVNLGSIIDGVDGELARLHYRFSRRGQWLDTIADDFSNVAYVTGIAFNLRAGGVEWALPFTLIVLTCFAYTQATQYWLIARVYCSGDLAAIPWAFQNHEFLAAPDTGLKATIAKMLKRDFALTAFVVLALCDALLPVLVFFSLGCLSFTAVFTVKLLHNLGPIRDLRHAASRSRN